MLRIIAISFLLTGCTPFVSYTHLSDPGIDDDSFDLACGGIELEKYNVTTAVAACHDHWRSNQYAKIDVTYRWKR